MTDDVVLNKAASIERCLKRVREEYSSGHEAEFADNHTRQDALVLNLLRACESSIDLAMHVTRIERLGLPQSSRDAFALLEQAQIIDPQTADRMKRMVGFRNIAVHEYREMNLEILRHIVEDRLDDFRRYTALLVRRYA